MHLPALTSALTFGLLLACTACSAETPADASPPPPAAKPKADKRPTATAPPAPAPADKPQELSVRVFVDTPAGPRRFLVEIADEQSERAKGLMHRVDMGEDAGMLFVFPSMRVQSFWMKNTRLALDMLFIDEQGVVVGIVENAEPMTTVSRTVGIPSLYVLELNAGTSRRTGLAAGQKVRFEGLPGHPRQPAAAQPDAPHPNEAHP